MELRIAYRQWTEWDHLRHLNDGKWTPMLDPYGKEFVGIEGKHGVRGAKSDGSHIGCDFIRMQPGSSFPLHMHDGDHELYIIAGDGYVHIDGADIAVTAGHLIHIPAEYPHGVWVADDAVAPLFFVATGHPHQHVDASNRMQYIAE
jgi:quercetin dioxygenase-like cupin family protein